MDRHCNYLLFVPSLLSRAEPLHYSVHNWDKEYTGAQTNEAVTKYLIDYLDASGEELEKIIMLCTDEVRDKKLPQIGNRTTLQYYKQEIEEYVKENIGNADWKEKFEVIPYTSENNEDIGKMIKPLEKIITMTSTTYKNSEKRLFIDFTGGSRSAALTLIFACRILQNYGVSVDKILYSNILSGQGKVEECTKTYHLFEYFASLIEKNYGELGKTKQFIENEVTEAEKEKLYEIIERLEVLYQAKATNQKTKAIKVAGELKEKSEQLLEEKESSYISNELLKMISKETAKELARGEKDDLDIYIIQERIKKKQYSEAMNIFREQIVEVLINTGIISVNKRFYNKDSGKINSKYVENEMAGAYYYYEKQRGKHTFMEMIGQYIEYLCEEPEKPPMQVMEERIGEKFFSLEEYGTQAPRWNFAHNDFSRKKCRQNIMPYILKYYESNTDVEKILEYYDKLDRIYMGYGFPFACTYSNQYLDGYAELYRMNFQRGVEVLQKYFEGNVTWKVNKMLQCFAEETFTYESLIRALQNKKYEQMLHILFPFQLLKQNIWSDVLRQEEWNEFIFDFVQAFCTVKDTRNKVIHPSNLEEGQFEKTLNEMERVIDWIKNKRK